MNYEEMSDFEINKAVSIALGHAHDGRGYIDDADGIYNVAIQWGRRVELPDYCNNPSDAMPILTENKIGFKWVNGSCTASSVLRGYHESESENPLRAAMIVFLMMEDAKNAD